jgi:hypothetical protein
LACPSRCNINIHIIIPRYEKSVEDEDIDHSTEASLCENVKEVLIQIFNFRGLKSPTALSSGIVAWEVLIFCEYRKWVILCTGMPVYTVEKLNLELRCS